MLAAAGNALIRTFFAPPCAACSAPLARPLAGPICEACWLGVAHLMPPLCVRCGDGLLGWQDPSPECPRCRTHQPVLSLARSAGAYEGALREIVHAFKFRRRRALAAPLAALVREAAGEVIAAADVAVPVPLHPIRALQRGFNQADDLARRLGLPVRRPLWRVRHRPPQSRLSEDARLAGVRRVFVAAPSARLLRNRSVLLVDDVMTTGATLEACARVLLEAGVRRVSAVTVARAVRVRPSTPPR
jgi:ComF family protein